MREKAPSIRATAKRTVGYRHVVSVRDHEVTADEPESAGGDDTGPSPQELLAASLASCTAVTMEMYAARKGWDLDEVEVEAEFSPAERGAPTRYRLKMRLPKGLAPEQVEKLKVIAAKCPVHRALDGEAMFDESVELV